MKMSIGELDGTVSFNDLRQNLARHLDQVMESRAPMTITRQGKGDIVLLSAAEFAGMEETLHLLRNPANAARLLRSVRAAGDGAVTEQTLVES